MMGADFLYKSIPGAYNYGCCMPLATVLLMVAASLCASHGRCIPVFLLQLSPASLSPFGALMLSVYNSDEYLVQPQTYMVRKGTCRHGYLDAWTMPTL
jgi:hypothetical protein